MPRDTSSTPEYATIQVVGDDIPVFLDGIPVLKGMDRDEIVYELLERATEIVEIDLVLMDREFGGAAVKDVCEKHDIHYLTPSHQTENTLLHEKRNESTAEQNKLRKTGADLQSELDAKDDQIQTLIETFRWFIILETRQPGSVP